MPDYKYKPSIMIDDLMAGLKGLQKEAATADKIIGLIGNKGNLNKLLAVFMSMDNMVQQLKQDSDALKSSFGTQLQNGYLANLDVEFGKLSDLMKETKKLAEDVLNVNLKKSDAPTQLKALAEQINSIYDNLGYSGKIDLNLFNQQSLKEQRDELIDYINGFGADITFSINRIDISKLGSIGDAIVGELDDAQGKVKASGEKLSSEVGTQLDNITNTANEKLNDMKKVKKAIKKAVTSFYDGVLNDDSSAEQQAMKSLQNELGLDNAKFKNFKEVFKQLEDGTTEEDDAIQSMLNIVESIKNSVNLVGAALDDGKITLANKFKEYYHAIEEAIGNGIDIASGEASEKMAKIKNEIGDILPNLDYKAKFDLQSIFESLEFDDIGLDDIEAEVNQLISDHGITIQLPVKDALVETQDETTKTGETIKQEADTASAAMEQVEDKTNSVTDAFKELIGYITSSGDSPKSFFSQLESGVQALDEELKNILLTLGLIDKSGNINFQTIKSGYTNKGGFVSDQYTMIARKITGDWGQPYLKKAEDLQVKLTEAKNAGAQIGAIFDIIKDEANGLFYEIQNTVPGTATFSHHKGAINADVLGASSDQLKDFVNTIKILTEKGLFIDWGGDNVLFDKNNGFSIIDLGTKGGQSHTVSLQNTLQENVIRFVEEMLNKATPGQSDEIKNIFAKRLYDIANTVLPPDQQIQYATKKQAKQTSAFTGNIQEETNAHKDNADAIKEENQALEAQIELKKKAQSMTWEKFALDESLFDTKKVAGIKSLSELENFWKQANYEKEVNFTELLDQNGDLDYKKAKQIIESKISSKLLSEWYGSSNHNAKNKIENLILSDDELRNAAMNWLYHIVQQYMPSVVSGMSFDDFLNTEFDVFRGDDGPVIYEPGQKLSFTFSSHKASSISGGEKVEGTKIKPKYTTGNTSINAFKDELEIFLSNTNFPQGQDSLYLKDISQTFEDYYADLSQEQQQQLHDQIIYLEKKRIENLLGKDVTKQIREASSEPKFDIETLSKFKQGIIPDQLDVVGDWGTQESDKLAEVYNNATETEKKLIAYYASLNAQLLDHLPGGKWEHQKLGQTGLINTLTSDPSGYQKYVDSVLGTSKFNLFGQTEQDISQEAQAHKDVAQAIKQESAAQDELNNKKINYHEVSNNIFQEGFKHASSLSEFVDLSNDILSVGQLAENHPDAIQNGEYTDSNTGELLDIGNLYDKINELEVKFGVNLIQAIEYLNEVYAEYNRQIEEALNAVNATENAPIDFGNIKKELFDKMKFSPSLAEENELYDLAHSLDDVNQASIYDPEAISYGQYTSSITGELLNVKDLYDKVAEIEKAFGTDLSNVKEYLNQVYQEYNAQLDKNLESAKSWDSSLSYKEAAQDELVDKSLATKTPGLCGIGFTLDDIEKTMQSYPNEIADGKYVDSFTGEVLDIAELYDKINDFESQLNIDLTKTKEYLDQVYQEYNAGLDKLLGISKSNEPITSAPDYSDIYYKLEDMKKKAYGQDYDKANDLDYLETQAAFIQATFEQNPNLIKDGMYQDLFSKELYNIEDLYIKIGEIENSFGIDLNYLRDYLNKVYEDFNAQVDEELNAIKSNSSSIGNISNSPESSDMPDFTDVNMKLTELAMIASESELEKLGELNKALEKINDTDQSIINDGMYFDPDNLKETKVSTIFDLVQDIEDQYGKNLDFVKKYLEDVYKNAIKNVSSADPIEDFENFDIVDVEFEDIVERQNNVSNAQNDMSSALQQSSIDATRNIENETIALNTLLDRINEVIQAVDYKTQAFQSEGVVVDTVIMQEIDALKQLEAYLDQIKVSVNGLFDGLNPSEISRIDVTNIPSGNTNTPNISNGDYALEATLQSTNSILELIFDVLTSEDDNKLSSSLQGVIEELKNVASGIAKHQNMQQADTREATERLADANTYQQISDIARNAAAGLGEIKLDGLTALKDGVVKVEGAFKNAQGVWEGFSVKVNKSNEAVGLAIKKQSAFAKALNETSTATKNVTQKTKAVYGQQVINNAQAKFNGLEASAKPYIDSGSSAVNDALAQYDAALNKLINTQKKFNNIQDINSEDANKLKTEFKEVQNECNKYAKELENLIKSSEKFKANSQNVRSIEGFDVSTIDGIRAALEDYVSSEYGANASNLQFDNSTGKLSFTLKDADGALRTMVASLDATGTAAGTTAGKVQQSTSQLNKFIGVVFSKWKELLTYFTARMGVDEIFQQIRNGIQYVRDIDAALTELKKVTNETDEAYQKFLQTASKTAGAIGTTVADFTNATADFARLGYSITEAANLAEAASIYKNVGDGIEDISQASESIISTMKAFGIEANNAMSIVDRFNEVGKYIAQIV